MNRAAKLGAGLAGILGALWLTRRRRAPRRIALTGNIASGKSAVADVWRRLGAVVIDADELARDAVAPGSPGLRRVLAEFGDAVRAPDGSLDRAALRALVFADGNRRRRLEAILHPEIERLRALAEQKAVRAGATIIVHAIPLLFETGIDDQFDVIVLVDAPADVRAERIRTHRGLSEAEASAMIEAQMPAAEKRRRSHHIIENTGTLAELERAAEALWPALGRAP